MCAGGGGERGTRAERVKTRRGERHAISVPVPCTVPAAVRVGIQTAIRRKARMCRESTALATHAALHARAAIEVVVVQAAALALVGDLPPTSNPQASLSTCALQSHAPGQSPSKASPPDTPASTPCPLPPTWVRAPPSAASAAQGAQGQAGWSGWVWPRPALQHPMWATGQGPGAAWKACSRASPTPPLPLALRSPRRSL